MCGIVGFTGNEQAAPILLDGLSKLEYRGYDSAGIAVRDGEKPVDIVKAKGRLKILAEKTNDGKAVIGSCGIGHTRWATHGEPSENNAHPHRSDDGNIVAVHNGIIENYQELKEKLVRKGYTFYSDTDTEVAVKIIDYYYKGIVTHEEFELAQLVIGNQKQKGFARDAGFSLKGKVKCGNCGLKMMYNYGAMPVVYCGHTAAVGSMSTCDKTRYSAAKIERIVLVALRKQLEIFQSMAKILEEGEEKNKTNLPAMQRNMEQELEKLKAERIRQYEAYAEGVVNQETYLKNKKDLNEKIEIIQDKYEQIQEVTSVEDNLMKDIRIVEKNAEEVNILKKMTRHIAETFVEEITIYDSEKIEIRFVFDDLLIGMADRIKKKTEDIA